MIAKAGLGLVGLGAIGVGGAALAKPSWFGMGGEDHMPECHYLSEDKDFSGSDYVDGTFGKKYGRYLVGVTNKQTKNNEQPEKDNKAWWVWAYRRLGNKDTRPEKFKSVTHGYSTNDNDKTFLNQVCKEAYKVKDKDGFGTATNQFKKSDVWKYCSLGTLVDISNDGYTNAQVGGQTENKKVFVSVKSSDNDWFWKIRNEDFWAQEGEWSGSKATGSDTESSFKKKYKENKDNSERTETIKEICKSVYELSKDGGTGAGKNIEDAKRFCVLELPSS